MPFAKPLYTRQRHRLLRCSALFCAGSMLLSPLTVRPSFRAEAETSSRAALHALPQLPSRLKFPAIVITHDPFIPSTAAALPVSEAILGDASTPVATAPVATAPVVRAVITGPSPKALVDIDGTPEVIGIGSALAGSVVTSISADAVGLENGQSLPFSGKRP
jgi:hypothetical protein